MIQEQDFQNQSFNYNFNLEEIRIIMHLYRDYPDKTQDLYKLCHTLEQYIYSIMSVEQVEAFFK